MSAVHSPSGNQPIHEVPPQPSSSVEENEDVLAEMMGTVSLNLQEDISTLGKNVSELGHTLTDLTKDMGLPPGIHVPFVLDERGGRRHARRVESPSDEAHGLLDVSTGVIYATSDKKELLNKAKKEGSLSLDDNLSRELGARGVRDVTIAERTIDPAKLRIYVSAFTAYNTALRILQIKREEEKKRKEELDNDKRIAGDLDRISRQTVLRAEEDIKAQTLKGRCVIIKETTSNGVKHTTLEYPGHSRKKHRERMEERQDQIMETAKEVEHVVIEKRIISQQITEEIKEKEVIASKLSDRRIGEMNIKMPIATSTKIG